MTLVYAVATEDLGFMVSDTLLTPLLEIEGNPIGPVSGKFHALKIQILDGKTAVAFSSSNNTDAAIEVIKIVKEKLDSERTIDVPTAVSVAYSEAIASCQGGAPPDCEFLVLKLFEKQKKLSRVSKSGIENIERGYLGDPAAYKRLMTLRKPIRAPSMESVQQSDGSFIERPFI